MMFRHSLPFMLALLPSVNPSDPTNPEGSGSGGTVKGPESSSTQPWHGEPGLGQGVPNIPTPQASVARHAPTTAPAHAGRKRPPMTMGSISLVLAQVTIQTSAGEFALTDLFDIQQVARTRNFQIIPILQAGERTPWASILDYEKARAFFAAGEALDAAGYGFPEERIIVNGQEKILPAESVLATLRFSARNNPVFRPRMFVNSQRFDRDAAQTIARTRQAMTQGTPEQRARLSARVAEAVEEEVALDELEGAQAIEDLEGL